jgi:hypothetical protein
MKYTRIISILLVVWLLVNQHYAQADNRIVVYLKHAPPKIIAQTLEDAKNDYLINNIQNIKNFETEALKNRYKTLLTPKLSGFVAIYAGYMDISNKNGMFQLPLRQAGKKIYVAFTEKIKLIKVKGNTVSHREFADPKKHKIAIYSYEKKTDDKNNYYWSVEEAQIPPDRKISPITLVIFTDPSNIFVKIGDFLSNDSQHFILPEIYVINTLHQDLTTLEILKVKNFFEPVKFEEKSVTEKSTQGILNNT